ncbi:hypothetical protein VFPBJ_06132 [Purpureocillium lilacinum]|uniref:Uncharacterized protein n=1 Tax=Purpureocillium lilacinum TaxID=33203 RepID=A0A179GRH0_PURLI|nr:hypothetical protein VFPBJ_06132 [Purpureocillium lilacinum]
MRGAKGMNWSKGLQVWSEQCAGLSGFEAGRRRSGSTASNVSPTCPTGYDDAASDK